MSTQSDWKKIVKEAKRQGWREETGGKGQVKLIPPDKSKQIVSIHQTPSDVRALNNKISEMRRQGFAWPPPGKGQK